MPDKTPEGRTEGNGRLPIVSTALGQLKSKLGPEPPLLDYIPLSEVQMITRDRMISLSPYHILVGQGTVQGKHSKIWAFISEKARHDGSIHVQLYSEDTYGEMRKHSVEEMDQHGQWLDLYNTGIQARNIALIKVRHNLHPQISIRN